MVEVTRLDMVDTSRCTYSAEGFLHDSPVLTRAGIFEYRGRGGKLVREFRPPEEVFHPDTLASMRGIPITVGHGTDLTDSNVSSIGTVLTEGRKDSVDELLCRGDIVIHNPDRGKDANELSLGYRSVIDPTPGVWNGQPYDAKQTRIRYNHLARVTKGRAGVARLRLDSDDVAVNGRFEEDTDMADVNLTSVRLDSGLEYKAQPEVAQALRAALDHSKALQTRLDAAEADRDTAKAKVTELTAGQDKIRQDAVEAVRGRMTLEADAAKLGVDVKPEMTDRQLREAGVKKIRGETFRMDGKTDDYVMYAFDAAVTEVGAKDTASGANRAAATPIPSASRQDAAGKPAVDSKPKPKGAADYRKLMISGYGR